MDFGKKWLGVGVSQHYKDTIKPLFERLENAKKEGMLWRDFPNKEREIYAPLLQAFKKEVLRIDENEKNKVPQKNGGVFARQIRFLQSDFIRKRAKN
ncbi:hypothetical protein HpDR28_13660 [Helicobacter pylori]